MKAIIVGGGIAGPATAMALQRSDIDSVILEARPESDGREGSYFTIAPNGLNALDALEARQVVQNIGINTRRNVMVAGSGKHLGAISLGEPLADGTVALTAKRSLLAVALADEASSRGIEIRHSTRVRDVSLTGEGIEVVTDDGPVSGSFLVGADGVHSVIRRKIDPDAPGGRYVGLTNFGGITRSTPLAEDLPEEAWHFVFGQRAFFGAHRTPDSDVVWFANVPRSPITREERATTTDDRWQTWLAEEFADDAGPAAALIADGVLELAADNTHDLPHVPRWNDSRMVLVGDAAHAPSPSSGQGASMALEDAVVLAQALRDTDSLEDAFSIYERERRPRVERIVKAGARSSNTKTPGPLGRVIRDTMLPLVFRYLITDRSTSWMTNHRLHWDAPVA